MSLKGNANKISGEFIRFVRQTALTGCTDKSGYMLGVSKTIGYVCNINEDGDLKGTIDVQEYNYKEKTYEDEGLHRGVRLSAIQDNSDGFVIVPMLYSDVVLIENPADGIEYVTMYSHAKHIQLQSHETIDVGIVETEEPNEQEDGLEKDYYELSKTGKIAITKYDKDTIKDEVSVKGDGLVETKTAKDKTICVGDTKITIDGGNVTIETSGKVAFKIGGTNIEESNGAVSIKSDNINAEGNNVTVKGSNVKITGGNLKVSGQASSDLSGPFNAIKVCPFSGAPHCGSSVSGT